MRTYIKISEPLREELINAFGVDRTTIYRAAHYISNSDQSEAIRNYALAHGGYQIRENFTPECSTEHVKGMMTHRFANGITVTINLDNSHAEVRRDGKIIREEEHVTLPGWSNLLYDAQMISAQVVNA